MTFKEEFAQLRQLDIHQLWARPEESSLVDWAFSKVLVFTKSCRSIFWVDLKVEGSDTPQQGLVMLQGTGTMPSQFFCWRLTVSSFYKKSDVYHWQYFI